MCVYSTHKLHNISWIRKSCPHDIRAVITSPRLQLQWTLHFSRGSSPSLLLVTHSIHATSGPSKQFFARGPLTNESLGLATWAFTQKEWAMRKRDKWYYYQRRRDDQVEQEIPKYKCAIRRITRWRAPGNLRVVEGGRIRRRFSDGGGFRMHLFLDRIVECGVDWSYARLMGGWFVYH